MIEQRSRQTQFVAAVLDQWRPSSAQCRAVEESTAVSRNFR